MKRGLAFFLGALVVFAALLAAEGFSGAYTPEPAPASVSTAHTPAKKPAVVNGI